MTTPNPESENEVEQAPEMPQEERAQPRPRVRTRTLNATVKKLAPEKVQSSISFPYMDLEAAISVAHAMLAGGGVALSRDQLAGVMGQAAGGGGFVTKVATARIFGLITQVQGKYELTDLGFGILDKDDRRQRTARFEAFLNVPLYKRAYDDFRGKQLPPRPHGLEMAFVKYGVAPKQKTNARLAFDKSAKQAGFFAAGPDRLIEPIVSASPASSERHRSTSDDLEPSEDNRRSTRTRSEVDLHPFIQGLLDTLPEPNTNWNVEGRAKWLQAAANIFDLIYNGNGRIDVTAKPEPKS